MRCAGARNVIRSAHHRSAAQLPASRCLQLEASPTQRAARPEERGALEQDKGERPALGTLRRRNGGKLRLDRGREEAGADALQFAV